MLYRNGEIAKPKEKLTKPVVFELVPSYKSKRTVEDPKLGVVTHMTCYPGFYELPCFYTIFDEKNNMVVEQRWCEHAHVKGAGENRQMVYSPEMIEIVDGKLTVYPDQPDLYEFLLNHPRCKDNPLYKDNEHRLRSLKKPFIFQLKNQKAISEKQLNKEVLATQAQRMLIDSKHEEYINDEACINMLYAYNEGFEKDIDPATVRIVLLEKAKRDPQTFLEFAQSAQLEAKAIVRKALDAKIIEYNDKKRQYTWGKSADNVQKGEPVVIVPRGKQPMEYFVNWLREVDDGNTYDAINRYLTKEEKKGKKEEKEHILV